MGFYGIYREQSGIVGLCPVPAAYRYSCKEDYRTPHEWNYFTSWCSYRAVCVVTGCDTCYPEWTGFRSSARSTCLQSIFQHPDDNLPAHCQYSALLENFSRINQTLLKIFETPPYTLLEN